MQDSGSDRGGPSSSVSVPLSSTVARAGTEHAQLDRQTGLAARDLATHGGAGEEGDMGPGGDQ